MLYFLLMNKVQVRVRLSKTRGACEGACENVFEVRLCVRRTRKFLATQRLQMSVEIAWKQNILVTDFHLLKSLLVVLGFGSQVFVCGFSRQNINSVVCIYYVELRYKDRT